MELSICGAGRIGRSLIRVLLQTGNINQLRYIIDVEEDISNIAYLINHDSIYGWLKDPCIVKGSSLMFGEHEVKYFYNGDTDLFSMNDIDVIIDSSGISRDWSYVTSFCSEKNIKFYVTHHPKDFPGSFLLEGVAFTEKNATGPLYSTSICDSVGISPLISSISDQFCVESVSIVSLHPWLSYQNLLDGTVQSVSNPGHSWSDYSLGRASTTSLIPKQTSVKSVLQSIFSEIPYISAMSYRVPTSIVTSAIVNVKSSDFAKLSEVQILQEIYNKYKISDYLHLNDDALVSIDYKERHEASILDMNFTERLSMDTYRFVVWYDNEWGYAHSVIRRLFNNEG